MGGGDIEERGAAGMGSWTLPDVSGGGGQEVVLCELDFKVSSI